MEAIATPGVTAPAWIMGGGQAEAGAEGGFGEALSRATVGATVGAEASTRVAHAGEAMPRALPAGGSAVPSLAPGVAPDATSVGAPQAAQQQAGAPDMPGPDAALATSPTATTEAAPPQLAGTGRASVQARANALAAGHHAMPAGPVAGAFPAQAAAAPMADLPSDTQHATTGDVPADGGLNTDIASARDAAESAPPAPSAGAPQVALVAVNGAMVPMHMAATAETGGSHANLLADPSAAMARPTAPRHEAHAAPLPDSMAEAPPVLAEDVHPAPEALPSKDVPLAPARSGVGATGPLPAPFLGGVDAAGPVLQPLDVTGAEASNPRLGGASEIAPSSAAPSPPPPPPARQVANMAIALAFAPALGQFRVALEPAELGRVEITVRRMGEAHQVLIVAERPETLALLQRDRAELDRALAESGVAVEDAGIGFSLESRQDGASHGGGNQSGGNQGRAAWTPAGPAASAPPAEPRRTPRSLLDLNV